MKKLLIPALAIAALGSANLAFGASFINASNAANTSGPWTYGVQFEVPAGGYFVISDIQVFDVQAGNTLRVGLWANGAANVMVLRFTPPPSPARARARRSAPTVT